MTYFNPSVFKQLTDLQTKGGYTPTVIINLLSKVSTQLLVNPSDIEEIYTNNIQSSDTFKREHVWVKNNKAPTYKFGGILLNTYRVKKSLESHLSDLRAILESDGEFSIVIGKRVFSPVVFSSLRLQDTLRFSGESAICYVELQAVKTPVEVVKDKGLNK